PAPARRHGHRAARLGRRAEAAYAQALRSRERAALSAPSSEFTEVSYVELRDALQEGRLEVHLQPMLELRRGTMVGVESLARWYSPRWGWVSPQLFVQFAEQTGLIGELSRWSINATLRHAVAARLAERGLRIALNLSPRLFAEPGLAEQIVAALKLWDVPASSVVLEITENAIMDNPERSAQVLEQLHAAGLRIAIDDFGVGYSSFAYLRQFPASELKIDQSFILDMKRSKRSRQLVRSMIDLAHHLDMQVVAEGVADAACQPGGAAEAAPGKPEGDRGSRRSHRRYAPLPPSATVPMLETIERDTGPDPRWAILWLHGLGADGHDFVPIVPELLRPGWPPL